MKWTEQQIKFRDWVSMSVKESGSATITEFGIDRIFPPIERSNASDMRADVDRIIRFGTRPQLQDPKSSEELLFECMAEVGIVVKRNLMTRCYMAWTKKGSNEATDRTS